MDSNKRQWKTFFGYDIAGGRVVTFNSVVGSLGLTPRHGTLELASGKISIFCIMCQFWMDRISLILTKLSCSIADLFLIIFILFMSV